MEVWSSGFFSGRRIKPNPSLFLGFILALTVSDTATGSAKVSLGRADKAKAAKVLIKNSRLFSGIDAYVTGDMDPGLFIFSGKLSEGTDIQKAEAAIDEEISKFIDSPITERELQKIINKTEARIAYSEINYQNKANNLAFFEYLGDIHLINTEASRYRDISVNMIKATAQDIFRRENSSTLYYLKKTK